MVCLEINRLLELVFVLGYFWYDICDIISNRRGTELSELLVHHVLVRFFKKINF